MSSVLEALKRRGYNIVAEGGGQITMSKASEVKVVTPAVVHPDTSNTRILKVGATGEKTGLEAKYENEVLLPLKSSGLILGYYYESVKLKLAPSTFYTPDYAVVTIDGLTEYHEIKGRKRMDDAMVKFKTAAEKFCLYRFKMVSFYDGIWHVTMDTVQPTS